MKKILLLAVFLITQLLGLRAFATDTKLSCTPTITTGNITNSTICAGSIIAVPFVLTDCVNPGNLFTIELSDAGGSFTNPTNIGSSSGTTSGTIVGSIPSSISFGSGYRVRVICSSPLTNGTDNGVDLVLLPKPNATFNTNNTIQCINGNSFTYTNTSTGSITSYNWKLGDGAVTTQTNVVYSYATAGTFNVTLTATGTNGCKDSITQTVSVQPKPVADFSYTGPNLCSTPVFNFTNTTSSTGTILSYWYFGDGDTSTSQNPNHTFATAGTYSVKLRVQSSNGCIDSITKTIIVLDKPLASFIVNNNSQCLTGNNFSFTNFSAGIGNTYLWQFGDGTTSTAINAIKTYLNIGSYTVKLIVTNINGCKDSITQDINVTSSPLANFTTGNTLCSIGLNVLFTNSSNGVNTYNWSFGDGTFSNNTNPSKTYPSSGIYNVKLVATGSGGCKDSITQSITVDSKASADFGINNDTQCVNSNLFTFTNNTSGAFISATWSFGDGVTSILTSPSKAYTVAGNYIVKLLITNANGCVDSISKSITVADKPVPKFTVAGNTSCSSTLNVSMTNASTGIGNTYVWDFGDGTNSTLVNPGKAYASTGSYVISLVATNFAGCKDSTALTLTFAPKPTASFSVNSNIQCSALNTFTFTNTSVGGSTYNWSFGDGFTSSAMNPTKQYTSAGTYTVKLLVTNASGCKDSITQVVSVLPKPTPDFTISGGTGCSSNLTIQLINLSSGSSPSYIWDFGDGTTATSTNPSKTYAAFGTYNIKLIVTNDNGCKDSISVNFTLSSKPVVNFTINNSSQCENNNVFTFTNTTTGASTYNWSFGDGFASTAANPTKQYTAAGTYTVKLVATHSNGCSDTISKTVTVVPKPNAGFTISGATGCTNNRTISFNNTSTAAGNTYSWDFGDGNISTATSPATTYATTGVYTIKLVVTNINGCKDSTTQIITFDAFPVAAISLASSTTATQCLNGNSFVFNGIPASGVTYSWNLGDGSTSSLVNPPAYSYAAAGVYVVKQIATNLNGCKDSTSLNVTVLANPIASFSLIGATSCTANTSITTNNTTTGFNNTYNWDLGDGSSSFVTNPSHTYTVAGTYNIKLVAINNISGCKDSVTNPVTFSTNPTATFTVNNNNQCVNNNSFVFTNTSVGGATYSWNFGDATTSTLTNPIKAFAVAGVYSVKLIVTTANGCKDSVTQVVTVFAKPVALFAIPGYNGCSNEATSFAFSNTSTNATSYVWDFGDGTTSTLTNPTKTYTTAGTFIVKLIAINANGCMDSSAQTISFIPKPIAGFSISSSGVCSNNTFIFTDTSKVIGTSNYYYYDFGDGTFSLLQNPTKVFAAAGTYKVILFVTNSNGCKDSTSKTIVVAAKPTASFAIANYTSCSNNNTLNFVNASTNATSYVWSFGDGFDNTSTNPTHTYSSLGTYNVKLVATNVKGCKDSATQTINLVAKPIAAFSYTSSGLCSNNTFAFTDASTVNGTATYYYDFGDGTFSLAKNPTKVFAAAGTYKVILFVTNSNGCKDSLIKTITVLATPKAVFTLSNFNPCSNNYTITTVNGSTNATSYLWDFGDGILTNQTNTTKTFAGIGTYAITLIATNANGCSDTARQTISYTSKPIAAFNVSSLGGCINNSFSFSDNSTVSGTPSYYYNFGDGVISLLPNATHIYSVAGTYKVIYVVTNSNGCKDSTNQTLIVTAKPKAAFTTPNAGGCSNSNSFSFINSSTNAADYVWDFGDGTGATTTNATKTFAGTGTFIVKLIAISATGCSDTTSQTFTIIPKPIASFDVSSFGGCNNNSFSFSDHSTVNGVATYFYDFGDATISLLQNPTHTYTAAGTYKVSFYVTNANGCKDSTSRMITVISKPNASFSLSGLVPCTNNNTITLVNNSVNATSYVWNFGDGNGSTLTNPTKTYTAFGTYKITLLATNSNGCVDSTSQTITLTNKPLAAFNVSSTSQCLTSNSFVFASVSAGNINSYVWNFGDGTTSTAANPTKTYTVQGIYTVTLTVTNTNGCSDVATQVVNVTGKPVISYTVNNASQCIVGNVYTFANTSPNQTGVSYYWNFGDGILSSLNTISKVYTSAGTFSVSLIAINSNGCIDSLVKTVNVLAKPTPSFSISSIVQCANNSFVFTNTTGSATANYTWKFGDGTTSTSMSPAHSYTVGGTYVVTLIASNVGGCIDSTSKTIFVTAKPVASFATSINNICADPATVTFNNTTTGSFSSLIWSFSDGTISKDINPVKTFAPGTYSAKLLVLSNGGCRDSVSQSFTIFPKLSAVFSFNSIKQCINNNSFTFTNTTNNTGLNSCTYKWDLGDGTLASTSAVTKSYLLPGNYNVKLLIANNTTGCRDSVSQVVSVNAQPTATLGGNGTICQGNSFVINTTFTGTPPFSFTYTDGSSNYFVSNVTTNLYGLGVSPLVTTTYHIISMNDAFCSASTAQVTATKSVVIVDTTKFLTQPISKTSCIGNTVLFSTKLSTKTLVSYQWQKNGVDIIGANADSLKLSNISILDSGIYRLVVALPCGSIYSNNARLIVNQIAVAPIYTAAVKYCQLDTAKPLVASGNILTWYSVATGSLGTFIAPTPNTLIAGTQTYWVSNNNSNNCESFRYPVTITILPKPTATLVAIGKTELQPTQTLLLKATASANALGIRWYYNDLPIGTLPNNQNLVGFNSIGKYQVDAVTADGCIARSEVIQVTGPIGLVAASEGNNLKLYPNPATAVINMYFDNPINQNATVRLVTTTGQILQSKAVKFASRFQPVQFNIASLRADIYAIEVIGDKGATIARNLFVKAN